MEHSLLTCVILGHCPVNRTQHMYGRIHLMVLAGWGSLPAVCLGVLCVHWSCEVCWYPFPFCHKSSIDVLMYWDVWALCAHQSCEVCQYSFPFCHKGCIDVLLYWDVLALCAHQSCEVCWYPFSFAIRVVLMCCCIEMYCCLVANGYDNPLCRIVPKLLSLYHRVVSRFITVFLLSPGVYWDVFLLPGYAYTQVSPLFEGKKFLTWNICTFVCNIVVKLQIVQWCP